MSKVKVVLVGRIESVAAARAVTAKLAALHAHKTAGPFDVAFGSCDSSEAMDYWMNPPASPPGLVIPLYLQDTNATTRAVLQKDESKEPKESKELEKLQNAAKESKELEEDATVTENGVHTPEGNGSSVDDTSTQVTQLAPNVYVLRNSNATSTTDPQSGIWRLSVPSSNQHLVVASLPPQFRATESELHVTLRHVSYTGCDILLSTEWPQGLDALVSPSPSLSHVSFDVADVAAHAKACYHVAFATDRFVQTPAFAHIRSVTSTTHAHHHAGRFVALCAVQAKQDAMVNDKAHKCLHALGIVPLHSQGVVHHASDTGVAPCPYTDVSYPVDSSTGHHGRSGSASGGATGLSHAAARRLLEQDRQRQVSQSSHNAAFRWNVPSQSMKRNRNDVDAGMDQSHNSTLFVYGLHKDVTGRLQRSDDNKALLDTFAPLGATAIRKPPSATSSTTSFCFVDFASHDTARACLESTGGEMTIEGVALQLKWATTAPMPHDNANAATTKRPRLTERDARDSSVVYFKYTVESTTTDSDVSLPTIGEALRQWMEHTLEVALAGDGDATVKAADEPALQVQLRLPATDTNTHENKRFGFLDFASHAAASMALATLTGSTDGGRVLDDQQEVRASTLGTDATAVLGPHVGLYLNWGTAPPPKHDKAATMIEDGDSHFKFERKHFPADARTDCWFCLASPACEKHLITGVYNTCYAAMPKGPVHEGHVLLVPVVHGSRGAWKDASVATEMTELQQTLRRHASVAYDADLFVFERAIQTKGGYHTHVQCIPVERRRGAAIQATMLVQAKKLGLELREINSDVGIRAVLGDDDNGYFYAEVPMGGMEYKRFLYQASSGTEATTARVPLQFGREILAAVLGDPNLAHWKSCVVDADQEASLATAFRESMAKLSVS